MTTKILLAKPEVRYPVKIQGQGGDVGIPLGPMYIAAYARQHNDCEVVFKDYRLEQAQGKIRNLEQDLADFDIVGAGACTSESPDALHILETAKRMGKTTVAGGLYPTFNKDAVLQTGYVDFVVRGEGEKAFSDLIAMTQGKMHRDEVNGISFMQGGKVVDNPNQPLLKDLDALGIPAYDLINISEYQEFGTTASIYSARGCPMTCKFCTLNDMWRYRYRVRSYENILEELAFLKEQGFERVHFKDETVTIKKHWSRGLFESIEQANLGLKLKVKSRMNEIEPELVGQLVRAGVDTIHTGVESVSGKALDLMDKRYRPEAIRQAFDTVLSSGARINPVYMFSWVGETPYDLQRNAEFIQKMGSREGVISYISFVTPHPGSGIEHEPGLRVLTTDYNRYTHKQPVAVPYSLGKNGLQRMVDTYHDVTQAIGMQNVNPQIDAAYLKSLETTMKGGRKVA